VRSPPSLATRCLNRLFDFRNPDIRGLVDDEAAGRLDELADELDEKGRLRCEQISGVATMSDDPVKNIPERENRIRERAYQLWEADGCPEGHRPEYWERAEAEINSEDSKARSG
jgi:Protein of unknown function (DUF2934)